jgi:hypothetical protein
LPPSPTWTCTAPGVDHRRREFLDGDARDAIAADLALALALDLAAGRLDTDR